MLGVFAPQVAAIAAGFAIIWALAWRRQEQAVAAVEERDGVRFYVDRTSPLCADAARPHAGLRRAVPADALVQRETIPTRPGAITSAGR